MHGPGAERPPRFTLSHDGRAHDGVLHSTTRKSHGLRTGGELVVDSLLAHGATHVFGVPGESYLPILDALHDVGDRLTFVTCRQEGGAAYMAEATASSPADRASRFVTRGPGASNAAIGIHTAAQDSTPMIVLVGQVGTDRSDREAFQEIDYRRMFGSVAKWAAQVDRAERIPSTCRARS